MDRPPVSDPAFWDAVYREGSDEFELGEPAPPLVRAARERPPGAGEVVVLGCGRGHEARMLAEQGWERVVGIDFSPVALAEAKRLTPSPLAPRIEWRQADLFKLPETDAGRYDLVVEHCCFCSIDPSRRNDWAHVARTVLRPHGHLLALFYHFGGLEPPAPSGKARRGPTPLWHHGRAGGPPFDTNRPEIERVLAGRFVIEHLEIPRDSIDRRQGNEILVRARRL